MNFKKRKGIIKPSQTIQKKKKTLVQNNKK